jgi:hypothetical protein
MKPIAATESPSEPAPPIGVCQCGCGGRTALAKSTSRKEGRIAGTPLRFLPGHQNRKRVRVIEEDRGRITPCRIWQLAKDEDGYGVEYVRGKMVHAHRAEYERVHGEIEDGLEVDHKCFERDCVAIDHLEAVDRRENLRRCGKCKLTRVDVIAIRRSNEPQHVLAERYGIDQSQVSRVKAGLAWRDVVDPAVPIEADPALLARIDGTSEKAGEQALPVPRISKRAA